MPEVCATLIAVTLPNSAAIIKSIPVGYTTLPPPPIILTSPVLTRPIVILVPTGISSKFGNITFLLSALFTLIYLPWSNSVT